MVLVQKWPFFHLFFESIQARKMSIMIFQNEQTPFQAIKTRSLKSGKIDIVREGLKHGFGPKMAIFPNFFFQAIQARKMHKVQKVEKLTFFQRGLPMVLVQKWSFFQVFFRQYRPGKCLFMIFYNKKTPFQAIKTRSSNSRKLTFFKKG